MRGLAIIGFSAAVLLSACASEPPRVPPAATAPSAPATSTPAVVTTVTTPAPAPRPRATGTPEDARRHMVRGMAAVEMAQSDEELAGAEDEFRMATEIDPNLAAAWFNLAAVLARMERHEEAIAAYGEYLGRSPDAEDAPRVRDEVIKLQYRQEQKARTHARAGTWIGEDGTPYVLTIAGNRLALKTWQRRVPESEVVSTYTLMGKTSMTGLERAQYQLDLQGHRLSGLWTREKLVADKCTIPGESAEVIGELNERERSMVLRYPRTLYRAATQMSLLSGDYCREVAALDKKEVEQKLYGPLPQGGLGVVLDGLKSWWEGGFSAIRFGWQGRLAVSVHADSGCIHSRAARCRRDPGHRRRGREHPVRGSGGAARAR